MGQAMEAVQGEGLSRAGGALLGPSIMSVEPQGHRHPWCG